MKDSSKYIINEDPIFFLPTLAKAFGVSEAIVLQKVHGWLNCKPHDAEGRSWIYNSYKSWHEQLPFLSEREIRRVIKSLSEQGVLLINNFNVEKFDKTNWYSIDYDKLDEVIDSSDDLVLSMWTKCPNRCGQNGQTNTNNITTITKENNNTDVLLKESQRNIPTLQEVEDYCKERNNNVDAKRFYDYYEVNDWKDKNGKAIKNWKQKMIANWETKVENQVVKEKDPYEYYRGVPRM